MFLSGSLVLAADAHPSESFAPLSSAATNGLTLESAIRLALEGNPELRASIGRMEAATGRAYQAKLWSNPELVLNAEDWPVNGGGGYSDSKQTIGVAQTIPFPGKKRLDRQIGGAGVRLSEAELSIRRLELVRDVKTSYFQVLAAESLVKVSGDLVKVAEALADAARKRVAAGAAADQEQLRAEIPLEQARAELSDFERESTIARQTLALLLGRPDLSEAPISGALSENASLALLDQSPERWLANHPKVVAVETTKARAQMELRRARLEPYPDVRMSVSGGREGESGDSIIEVGFSIPLPIIDRSKGKKQEMQANLQIAVADQAAAEQQLLRAWVAASKKYRTAAEQVTNFRQRLLPKADEALRLVQTGFEAGKFGFIDLLDTQRTSAEVRLTYQRKLLDLNAAQAELEYLIGGKSGHGDPVQPNQSPTGK